MGRFDSYTVPVTAEELRSFAKSLRLLADAHDALADKMSGPLELRNFKSATDALDDVSRFLGLAVGAVVSELSKSGLENAIAVANAKSADAQAMLYSKQLIEHRNRLYVQIVKAWKEAESLDKAGALNSTGSGQSSGQGKKEKRNRSLK